MFYTFLIVLIACIWGSGFLLMKNAVTCYSPPLIGMLRAFIASGFLFLACYLTKTYWKPQLKEILNLVMICLLGFTYPFSLQPMVIEWYGSAFIGMLLGFLPIFTLIVSRIILKSKFSTKRTVGVLGGLFFLGLLLKDRINHNVPISGFLLAVSTPISYTFSNIFIKRDFHNVHPLPFTAWCSLIGATLTIPLAIYHPYIRINEQFVTATLSIVILGILMTGLALLMFYHIILKISPMQASLVNYIVPIIAMIWGIWANEELTSLQYISIIGVFMMIALSGEKRQTNQN